MRSSTKLNIIITAQSAFSLMEVLLSILIIGLLGIASLKSISYLKLHNYSMQKFLLTKSSLFETQLFIHKYLNFAKIDSIKIYNNKLEWFGYDSLFLPATQQKDYMDFSLHTNKFSLELKNRDLFFNNAILLHNVYIFETQIITSNNHKILQYKVCSNACFADFVLLEDIEQTLP